jgi:hypothetical protein
LLRDVAGRGGVSPGLRLGGVATAALVDTDRGIPLGAVGGGILEDDRAGLPVRDVIVPVLEEGWLLCPAEVTDAIVDRNGWSDADGVRSAGVIADCILPALADLLWGAGPLGGGGVT